MGRNEMGKDVSSGRAIEESEGRRLRRVTVAWWCHELRQAALRSEGIGFCARILRGRQTGRGDLSCTVDVDRCWRCQRKAAHVVSFDPNGLEKCRGGMGGRTSGRGRRFGDEPK